MLALILGLLIFLGIHSTRLFAGNWRDRQVQRMGLTPWKGIYSLVSLVGLVLIALISAVYGLAVAGKYISPVWGRWLDVIEILMIVAIVPVAAWTIGALRWAAPVCLVAAVAAADSTAV